MSRREYTGPKKQKVVPGDEDDEDFQNEQDDGEQFSDYDDDDDIDEGFSFPVRMIRKTLRFCLRVFSLERFLNFLVWLIDIASVTFTVKFDDILSMMTFLVLFAQDIKVLANSPPSVDPGLDVVMIICILFFVFEWFSNTIAKTSFYIHCYGRPGLYWVKDLFVYSRVSGYLFSFPWLLDLVFIIFICPEITWVQNYLHDPQQSLLGPTSTGITERGARLVRVIKAIQLFRAAAERRKKERQERELMDIVQYGDLDEAELMQYVKTQTLQSSRESKLGNQLKESTVRRIILIVYSMFFIVPLLIYYPTDNGPDRATQLLFNVISNPSLPKVGKQAAVSSYISNVNSVYGANSLLYLDIYPSLSSPATSTLLVNNVDLLATIRPYMQITLEHFTYDPTGATLLYHTKAIISYQAYYQRSSLLTIFLYVFIASVLAGGFWAITDDVQRLVLAPIERMMNMVDEVSRNPLQKLQFDRTGSAGGEYEMSLLESTLEKITSLLRIGFGEAGANIIKANLNNADGSCTINPLLPGIRIYAILGFCDIHHFEYCTQQLGNDVLTFTNAIAEIVHSNVHSWRGACNKNLGNAFVLLWRIGDEEELLASYGGGGRHMVKRASLSQSMVQMGGQNSNMAMSNKNFNPSSKLSTAASMSQRGRMDSVNSGGGNTFEFEVRKKKEVDLKRVPDIERWADHALISYLKIIVAINRNKRVLDYRVESRLTMDGARDFKVRMGFGLHAGWAIEGAVGSLQKVDATYLSPHVNMAARLETSSRQYGVPVLMSEKFYELMSDEGKELCRRVDRVTVKGSEMPIDIYTYDALQDQEWKPEKGTGAKASKGKGLKMLGLDAGAAGFDFSVQANEQEGNNRKNISRPQSAMDGSKSGSSNIWGAIKTSVATTMAEGINALSVSANDSTTPRGGNRPGSRPGSFRDAAGNGPNSKHQRPLGGSFHSTPQAAGLAPQFATSAPMTSPISGKTAFGHNSSSSHGAHSTHSSGAAGHVRSQTSSLDTAPNAVEAALREVNQKFKAGEASKPSKEVLQGNQQTVISALNSTVDGQFSVKVRTSLTGSVGSADNRGSASNMNVTIRDDNAAGAADGSGQGQTDTSNVSGGGEGDQPSLVAGQDPNNRGGNNNRRTSGGGSMFDNLLGNNSSAPNRNSISSTPRDGDGNPTNNRVSGGNFTITRKSSGIENPNPSNRPLSAKFSGKDLLTGARGSGKGEGLIATPDNVSTRQLASGPGVINAGTQRSSGGGSMLPRRPSIKTKDGGNSQGQSQRRQSNASQLNIFNVDSDTAILFERDPDLKQLRAHITKEFRDQFETGLVHYLTGDWGFARDELEKANEMMRDKVPVLGGDGPSLALLKYMDQYDYIAPASWSNYRPLTSK